MRFLRRGSHASANGQAVRSPMFVKVRFLSPHVCKGGNPGLGGTDGTDGRTGWTDWTGQTGLDGLDGTDWTGLDGLDGLHYNVLMWEQQTMTNIKPSGVRE